MHSQGNWDLHIDDRVPRKMRRFPRRDVAAIHDVISALPIDPYAGDIEKIKGEDAVWRRRAGSYRIFFELNPKRRSILVFHVERRTSRTY